MLQIPDIRQQTGYTCGPAAVRAALAVHGWHFGESDLAAAMGTTSAGTSPRGILAGLRATGFRHTAGAADLADLTHWTRRGIPVVALVTGLNGVGHYVTVAGTDRRNVTFQDPTAGPLVFRRAAFLNRWHDGQWRQWACAIRQRPR
jgi:predicted double-glycine peptidase